MKKQNSERFTMRIPTDLLDSIKAAAGEDFLTVSVWLRRLASLELQRRTNLLADADWSEDAEIEEAIMVLNAGLLRAGMINRRLTLVGDDD